MGAMRLQALAAGQQQPTATTAASSLRRVDLSVVGHRRTNTSLFCGGRPNHHADVPTGTRFVVVVVAMVVVVVKRG